MSEAVDVCTKNIEAIFDTPVHDWFGLTYSHYLVIPRTLLEQMPPVWQREFVKLLDQANEYFEDVPEMRYCVTARDPQTGRYIDDPLSNYRRPISLKPKSSAD